MDRRAFLKSSAAAAAVSALPWRGTHAAPDWQTYEVVTRIEIQWPQGTSRVWLPMPLIEDTGWQRNLGSQWTGNASRAQTLSDGKYGVPMLYAEWNGSASPVLELTSRFATRDHAVDLSRPRGDAPRLSAADLPARALSL